MMKVSLLIDYEKLMTIESKKKMKTTLKDEDDNKVSLMNAAFLMKYIFENILEWTPYMIRDYFTPEIAKWLHIDYCVAKIPFPPELDHNNDYFFVAHYLYPDILPYNKKKAVLEVYNRERNKKSPKFPRKFFQDKAGKDNLDICLKYIISENFYAMDNKAIYDYFSDIKRAKKFIDDCSLATPVKNHYSSVLNAIHSVLPEGDKDETYYHLIVLNNCLEKKKIHCEVKTLEDS